MNGVDGLIQWMTHRGQGRWESFKDLVGDIYAHEEQPPKPRWVANTLSMTGVGEFFVSGSNRWRVFAPLIAGISLGQAVVVGGRTATLKEQLRAAATAEGIDLFEEPLRWNVTRIRLYALTDGDLQRVAERTGIPFVPQAADRMIRQAPTLEDRVAQGQRVQAPRNWCVESYDFSTFNWVGRDIAHSAKAFTPSRGVPRYTFEKADGSLVQMERRESVYAAAFSQSIALLAYDPDSSIVSVPSSAPLPADMERAVALCTGDLPSRENGRSVFAGVRWSVGSVLLALTGCPLPVIPYRPQGVRQ